MAEEKKKTTTKKKTTSTKKTNTTKKSNSSKPKTSTKKSNSSKPKTSTKKTVSSSTIKTKSTSTKKSTSAKKSTNSKKSTTKKTTPKKATKTPKKSTSSTKKTTVKKEVKPVVREEQFEYTNSYTLTDIFNNHKKEETKIKPEDVVFEDDKDIKESNLSVEEELDKVLEESNILDIPEEKEFVVEEPEIKEEIKDKPIVIEERAFGREERPKKIVKKRKLKNWVYIALILIFILIIGFSIFKIVSYKPLNDQLNEKYVNVLDGGYKEYDIDFNGLKKLNKNTVGYVKVNATNINHVVVKGKDNKYYKEHNFLKKKSRSGWIYMDSRNKLDGTDKNIVIYGSNNNDMFGSLSKVLTDKWQKKKEYHYITYVSDNFEYRYQVFSTYESNDDIKINFNKQIDYANYIQDIRKKSNYDYDVYVGSFDNILTLVSYDGNKRIIVHAKLIK
ncbi:MAG: class B sortase [Bacilli bacterium]|nr:class B sortase [Bacilli bacterium]